MSCSSSLEASFYLLVAQSGRWEAVPVPKARDAGKESGFLGPVRPAVLSDSTSARSVSTGLKPLRRRQRKIRTAEEGVVSFLLSSASLGP